MSNKVFKNYQVNMGMPFQVKSPINFNTIKRVDTLEVDTLAQEEKEKFDYLAKANAESILEKAREEAEFIIKEAQLEAARTLERAEKEASQNTVLIEEEARRKGYEDGLEEAKLQYEGLLVEAEYIKEQAKVEYKEVLAGIEADALNMILDIAKKVIGVEIAFNKDDILYLVKQAFEKCSNRESIVLKVSGEDYDFLTANKDRLLSMVDGVGELDIRKDASLKVGGCIVETPYGSIDAGVQTKLRKIEEAFIQMIRR